MIYYVLVLFCCVAFMWCKWKTSKFEKFAVQFPGEQAYTIIGHLERVIYMKNRNVAGLLKWCDELFEKYQKGGITKFWIFHLFSVVIWRHDLVEAVSTNPKTSKKGKLFYYLVGDFVNGLVLNEGTPDVKERRKCILQMMKKKYLDGRHHRAFLKHSKEFVEHLYRIDKKEVNIWDEVLRVIFELFGETNVGVGGTEELKIISRTCAHRTYRVFQDRIVSLSMFWTFMFRWHFISKYYDGNKSLYSTISWIIKYRKMKIKEGIVNEDSYQFFTDDLIKRGIEKNTSEKELIKELLEGILAGPITIGIMLSSLLVFLAIHRDVQEQVYQEQVSIFGDDVTREPNPEDLSRMELLGRVIKETMRLINPPFIHKQATADIKLGEYMVPKDTFVIVYVRKLHRNPAYWERPEQFYPDHFLPEQVQRRPDYAYIPFGIGVRRCPGERYALATLPTLVSTLIRNFKFSSKWAPQDLVYEMNILCGFQRKFYNLQIENRSIRN